MELKEKLNGALGLFGFVVVLSCRATVGGFHSDSVFGVDTQISQDVNCLSAGPLLNQHSVQQRLFSAL